MTSLNKGKRVFVEGKHGTIKRKDWDMSLGGQVYAIAFDDGTVQKYQKKNLQQLAQEGIEALENSGENVEEPKPPVSPPAKKPTPPKPAKISSPQTKPEPTPPPPKKIPDPVLPSTSEPLASIERQELESVKTPTLADAKKNKNSKNLIAMFNKAVQQEKESLKVKQPLKKLKKARKKSSANTLSGKVNMFNQQIKQEKKAAKSPMKMKSVEEQKNAKCFNRCACSSSNTTSSAYLRAPSSIRYHLNRKSATSFRPQSSKRTNSTSCRASDTATSSAPCTIAGGPRATQGPERGPCAARPSGRGPRAACGCPPKGGPRAARGRPS